MPREDENVVRTPAETLARARDLLDDDRPFAAHEVFEAAWKNGPPAERDLWQGLAQLCVAMTHVQRGNRTGARALFERSADRLRTYAATGGATYGVDLATVTSWAAAASAADNHDELVATSLPLN